MLKDIVIGTFILFIIYYIIIFFLLKEKQFIYTKKLFLFCLIPFGGLLFLVIRKIVQFISDLYYEYKNLN
jgi:hypothetical protein